MLTPPAASKLIPPDACERIVVAALTRRDMRGVQAALTHLALQDPARAQEIVDTMRAGLALNNTANHPDAIEEPADV